MSERCGCGPGATPQGPERREVPIRRFLADELMQHVAGCDPSELEFTGVKGGLKQLRPPGSGGPE